MRERRCIWMSASGPGQSCQLPPRVYQHDRYRAVAGHASAGADRPRTGSTRSPTSPRGLGSICFRRTRCRPQRDGCLPQTQPRPQSRPGLESTQRGRVRTIRRGSPVYWPGDQGGWANMRAPRTNAVIAHGEDMVGDLIWERPSLLSMAVWSALRRGQTDNRCRRTSPDRGRRKLALRAASCASLLGAGKYRGTLQAAWGR